jgi:septal ring factor EnvC (AmiA/AmiB activator)
MRVFINSTASSPKVKEGLKQAIALRWALNKTQREVADQQQQLKTITDDQTRLRANLKEMPPTAAAYKRYLDKFDQQETQIDKYQADIKKMQETEHQQQKEFEDFLNNFSAE